MVYIFFFFQAEDGIRDLVRSRGLGDVYKRQVLVGGAVEIIPMLTIESNVPTIASVKPYSALELELSLIHI